MSSEPDRRSVERVMLAASSIPTRDDREACIVGGIVRSILDTRHFDPGYASHSAAALLEMGKRICAADWGALAAEKRFPNLTRPTATEMGPMVEAFRIRYDPTAGEMAA